VYAVLRTTLYPFEFRASCLQVIPPEGRMLWWLQTGLGRQRTVPRRVLIVRFGSALNNIGDRLKRERNLKNQVA
jgi:hypothetical protein